MGTPAPAGIVGTAPGAGPPTHGGGGVIIRRRESASPLPDLSDVTGTAAAAPVACFSCCCSCCCRFCSNSFHDSSMAELPATGFSLSTGCCAMPLPR